MPKTLLVVFVSGALAFPAPSTAQKPAEDSAQAMHHHHHPGMIMDAEGMVMNENKDQLPRECHQLAGDIELTVRSGTKYAQQGTMFGYDQHEWNVEPCTRITVTLINEDSVRHQWMVHGLPRYLYPQGMFHMEVAGLGRKTGTFIVPGGNKTYFIHCDIAQHMEKGMKAQLKVGGGDGDLPSIPGISAPLFYTADSYLVQQSGWTLGALLMAGLAGAVLAVIGLRRILVP
jgi:hypothetical protein